MKKIFSTDDRIQATYIQSVLEDRNITCWIKNLNLSGAVGELPPIECWPEVWIHDDRDFVIATKIIEELNTPANDALAPWACQCGEQIEAQFRICWQCGSNCPVS